jgi:mono/diheme cytochrome c family protein
MLRNGRSIFAGVGSALLVATSAMAGASDPQDFTQVERGRYLAVLSDCASCHTVPGSNQPFAGGRAIETPFGNIVAPNITPDLETGIGSWSDEAFDVAIRKGLRPNGSPLYPAMPYTAYTKMSADDVLAIRAYLNTITPVRNAVIANTLPFPFNIRAAMRVWNALYFTVGEYRPDTQKSSEWNRGAFLVDGPGHCGACHTPKTLLGGDRADQYLRGGHHRRCPRRLGCLVSGRARCLPEKWSQPGIGRHRTDGRSGFAFDAAHDEPRSEVHRDIPEVPSR